MKIITPKYAIIPFIVLILSIIIQIPIINFVKVESSRYMMTDYRKNVKDEILGGVENKVKVSLKDSLKPEVIQELRIELLDEVMEGLRGDLIKEIRGDRKWVSTKNFRR